MRKLWIRFVLWWEGYCFKHGLFGTTNSFGVGCPECLRMDYIARKAEQLAKELKWRERSDKLYDYVAELDKETHGQI